MSMTCDMKPPFLPRGLAKYTPRLSTEVKQISIVSITGDYLSLVWLRPPHVPALVALLVVVLFG